MPFMVCELPFYTLFKGANLTFGSALLDIFNTTFSHLQRLRITQHKPLACL